MIEEITKQLKVFVDVFGNLSFAEKFPDEEQYGGLNDMLKELSDEYLYGDKYDEPSGFYLATLEVCNDYANNPELEHVYLQVSKVERIDQ